MTRNVKNKTKDLKFSKSLNINDFFRFEPIRAMTLTVPRTYPGDHDDLHLTPENENAGMLAHPDVDVSHRTEAQAL